MIYSLSDYGVCLQFTLKPCNSLSAFVVPASVCKLKKKTSGSKLAKIMSIVPGVH